MQKNVLARFLIIIMTVQAIDAYRILCLFPFNSRSHFRMFGTLCKGLAQRGHRIDMISHFPIEKPIANYTDIIDLRGTKEAIVNSLDVRHAADLQTAMTYYIATKYGGDYCDLLGHKEIQRFIKDSSENSRYDLLITEGFNLQLQGKETYFIFPQLNKLSYPQYLGSPCFLGLGQTLNTPMAIALSFLEAPYVDNFMNNPFNFAFFPGALVDNAVIDTFLDRLWNLVKNYKEMLTFYYYTSDQTEMVRKHLGRNLPNVRELERNVSLALVNSHHTFHGVRPLTPAVVEVGGLHVESDDSDSTSEISDWVESAEQGLVYFTLGSLLNIETLPRDKLLSLYRSFAKISPVKVLMRCTDATKLPNGLPSNVATSAWIPQIAVLRHKNTRVFITHGGLMGSQEAVHYGVPVIGIPIISDQMRNINIMVHKKMGILIRLEEINEQSMDAALDAVLHDPKYRESAKKMSKLFRDRPLSALNTAIYWIEYVIRNGPDSLRSPAADMPWWKLNFIDIFVFLITCVIVVLYLSSRMMKIVLERFRSGNARSKSKHN